MDPLSVPWLRPVPTDPSTAIIAVLMWFLASIPASAAAQNASNGPLPFEEGSPLHRIGLTPTTASAQTLPAGAWEAALRTGVSNVFEQDSTATHVLFLDLERVEAVVSARYGLSDRLEVGARISFERTGPGRLDGLVHAFHDAFGLGQANRDLFPRERYDQRLTDGGSVAYLDVPARGLGLVDLRTSATLTAATSSDGRDRLAFRGEVRLPTGGVAGGGVRPDAALALLGRFGMGSWYVHADLGATTVHAPTGLEPVLRSATTSLALALERSFGAISGVVQYQVQSPMLEGFDHREIDRAASNLVFGAAGRLGGRWRWAAWFQEDLPSDTPAVDFTLGVRIARIG